jgi:hypothetical protein
MRFATVLAVLLALVASVHVVSAQTGQPRHPAASRSASPHARAAARDRMPPPGPTQDEKNWMDRASSQSNGGGGGGGGGGM